MGLASDVRTTEAAPRATLVSTGRRTPAARPPPAYIAVMGVPTVKTHDSRIPATFGLDNRVRIALLVHGAGPLDLPDPDGGA
ncbi:hypothetical protein GCM10017752_13140 [Streptomyces roseoviridis]